MIFRVTVNINVSNYCYQHATGLASPTLWIHEDCFLACGLSCSVDYTRFVGGGELKPDASEQGDESMSLALAVQCCLEVDYFALAHGLLLF